MESMGDGINIWSGARGLGGALTNMSGRAYQKGGIRHQYPVTVGTVTYPDVEAAYQAMKVPGNAEYNDGLMIDLICLKFMQHPNKLKASVTERGGVSWLARCGHFVGAKSDRAKSWEGQGVASRFIRNLIYGYQKSLSGEGPATRVVHVKEAPFDVYIGRDCGGFLDSGWGNNFVIGSDGTREEVVFKYHRHLLDSPELLRRLHQLRGKTLGCWCKSAQSKPDGVLTLCHGDVLAALADGISWEMPLPAQGRLFS